MANGRIDENGLPVYAPGDYDYVRVVDRSTGASRNALAPEVTVAARHLAERLDEVVADAEADIAPVIAGLGYLPPVPYASGLNVDSTRFTVIRDGQAYAPAAPVPFTTDAWNAGQWRLVQGVTAADLSAPYGAHMIGVGTVTAGKLLEGLPMTGALTSWISRDLSAGTTNPVTTILGVAHGMAVGVTEAGSLRLSDNGKDYGPVIAPSATLPWIPGGNSRLLGLDDGEVLLIAESGASLWRSSGWPAPTGWTKVLDAGTYGSNTSRFHQGWGVRVAGQYVLASEYGNPKPNAHRVYLSTDYGATFSTVFDQRDHQVIGPGSNAHMHGGCIDPWGPNGPRLWVMTSDTPFNRLWWTDDLTGSSWTPVADADYDVISNVADIANPQNNEQPPPTYVVIDATPWGLVLGQDDFPEGTAYIPRDERYAAAPQVKTAIKFPERLPTLMYVAQDQAIVGEWVFTLHNPSGNMVSDGKTMTPPRITVVSARTGEGAIVWEGTESQANLRAIDVFANSLWVRDNDAVQAIEIPLYQGGAVRQLPHPSVSSARETSSIMVMAIGSNAEARFVNSMAIGPNTVTRAVQQTVIAPHADVTGVASIVIGAVVPEVLGYAVGGERSIAIGYRPTTGDGWSSQIAIGTQSSADNNNAIAIGSSASASGTGAVCIGATAEAAGSHSVGIGRNAKAIPSRAVAIGDSANVTGLSAVAIGDSSGAAASRSVAIGFTASANNGDSVALGSGAETTQTFQVAIGARYFEVGVFTSNRQPPPADRAALWVHNNGGTYELRMRRPDGAMVKFTQEAA